MESSKFNGLLNKINSELTQYQLRQQIANIQIFQSILDANKRLSVEYDFSRNLITITKYIIDGDNCIDTHYSTYNLTLKQYQQVKELFNACRI